MDLNEIEDNPNSFWILKPHGAIKARETSPRVSVQYYRGEQRNAKTPDKF